MGTHLDAMRIAQDLHALDVAGGGEEEDLCDGVAAVALSRGLCRFHVGRQRLERLAAILLQHLLDGVIASDVSILQQRMPTQQNILLNLCPCAGAAKVV